jgi:hypothetical protein
MDNSHETPYIFPDSKKVKKFKGSITRKRLLILQTTKLVEEGVSRAWRKLSYTGRNLSLP